MWLIVPKHVRLRTGLLNKFDFERIKTSYILTVVYIIYIEINIW